MRPVIPGSFQSSHGKLADVMEEAWEKDHNKRPSFRDILDRLSPCSLSYALNDDIDAIKMWSKHFNDKTSVPVREFLAVLWKAIQKSEPPDPFDDRYINLKVIKAVILPPGTNRDTVTLERFGLFLHWYGPLIPLQGKGEPIFQKLLQLLKEEWYHGEISGSDAEELLSIKNRGGDYLVRCSLNPHAPFTMSRILNNTIVHYRIAYNRTEGKYKMQYHNKKSDDTLGEITGSTLSEFVKQSIKLVNLKSPVKCYKYLPLF